MRASELKAAITRFNNARYVADRVVRAAVPLVRDEKDLEITDLEIAVDGGGEEYVRIYYRYPSGLNLWELSDVWIPLQLWGCSDRAIEKYMIKGEL